MEKDLERKLVKAVRDSGGLALKFVSPGMAGVPDRLLLFPGGRAAFAEVKAPGEKPRPLQVHRMDQLGFLGFRSYVVDSEEKIGEMIREISSLPQMSQTGSAKARPERSPENDPRSGTVLLFPLVLPAGGSGWSPNT